jgi:ribosomal protein S18 acetylase RimI-like enzyme
LTLQSLQDDGWTLSPLVDAEITEIMTWFPSAESVNIWGGPNFRFPFTGETFREDCRLDLMRSWTLRHTDKQLAAFGQAYERDGRGHLARLVSNPGLRRQGAGRRLIEMIIALLEETQAYDEYSLFVYRDNTPAYRCYLSLGFAVQDYPDDAPMPEKCYFLTRKTTRRR